VAQLFSLGVSMRFVEYIVKMFAVWVALWITAAYAVHVPIALGWMSETDFLALVIIGGSLLFSLLLAGFAVFARRRLASYSVLWIVGTFRVILVICVLFYPIFLGWSLHGFWGAVGTFCLPLIAQAWAVYINIRQGAFGFPLVICILLVYAFIYDWCRFKIPEHETDTPNTALEPTATAPSVLDEP